MTPAPMPPANDDGAPNPMLMSHCSSGGRWVNNMAQTTRIIGWAPVLTLRTLCCHSCD